MSTGGRVFPSVTGGGLARGTGAIVDAIARRRQEALQIRQIENSERITSLNAITQLLPHLPEGTTLGDLDPASQQMFGDAMGIDPSEPIFQAAELNRETVASMADKITVQRLGTLSPDELAQDEAIRAALGLNPIQAAVDVVRTQSEMILQALDTIFKDPARMIDFVKRQEGLDPITLEFPDGTTKSFDRGLAAQLYVTMLRDQDADDFRFKNMDAQIKQDSINQIIEQVALREVAIAAPAVQRAMDVYDRALEASDYGIIAAFMANPGIGTGDKLAMEVLDRGMLFGEAHAFRNLPESIVQLRDIATLVIELQKADPEELQTLVDELDPATFGRFTESFFFRIGAPKFRPPPEELGTRTRAEADAAAAEAAGRPVLEARDAGVALEPTVEEQIQTVLLLLDEMDRDSLVARTSEEVVVQAEARRDGVIDPDADPGDAVEPDDTGVLTTLSADQQAVVGVQQNDLAELERLFAEATNPRNRSSLNARIGRLRSDIALNSTVLPIQTEDVVRDGQVTIPAGGIDPANMPATARTAVLQLNILIRRRANITRGRAQEEALEFSIARQKTRLRRILAQG